MQYVFGPVPSRRLGRSLGIDTVPLKVCNWNCAYCQLGRSTPVVHERKEYVPAGDVLAEVRQVLDSPTGQTIDWITFVGSGEGTLHSGIGELIRAVKEMAHKPVAVITNGSLLYLPEVRADLAAADAVLPTLDAANDELYRRIDRPHPSLTFERHLGGLKAFAAEYTGKLWVEVMLVGGLNDTEPALQQMAAVLDEIDPDEIHLVSPTRCTAETWVQPPDEEGLMRALAILGPKVKLAPDGPVAEVDLGAYQRIEDAIVSIVTRHPLPRRELEALLSNWPAAAVQQALCDLIDSEQLRAIERFGRRFFTVVGMKFGADQ